MRPHDLSAWMWSDAISLLERAQRLHRQFFLTRPTRTWEPPIDVVESADTVSVYVALPGVPPAAVAIRLDPAGVTVSGVRTLPGGIAARLHRIEIPYGRFERHIPLPLHFLEPGTHELVDGCLVLTFSKSRGTP